jgi:hypothetical protein
LAPDAMYQAIKSQGEWVLRWSLAQEQFVHPVLGFVHMRIADRL